VNSLFVVTQQQDKMVVLQGIIKLIDGGSNVQVIVFYFIIVLSMSSDFDSGER